MRGHAAGYFATATCAIAANGFLLPPGVNSIDNSLLTLGTQSPKTQSIRIPCAECAFSTKQAHAEGAESDGLFRIEGGANELLLNFTTSEDNSRLELNGAAIYPPLAWVHGDFRAVVHQVPAGADDAKVPLRVTSSGLLTDVVRPDDDDDAAAVVVTLRYTVLGVEHQLMQLQDVRIELLKVGDELSIIKLEAEGDARPGHHGPPSFHPHHGPPRFHGPPPVMFKECHMLPASICKFKHMLETKIASIRHKKPCPGGMGPPHGRVPSHIRPPPPHVGAHGEHPHTPHGRPHHGHPWHGHAHGHHHHHRLWAGAFMRGFVAVLLPVAAGITVGLTVSLIGLLLGRLITMIWIRCTRRGQRAREAEFMEEGKGLMLADEDGDEELPAYEHAPAYEEHETRESK